MLKFCVQIFSPEAAVGQFSKARRRDSDSEEDEEQEQDLEEEEQISDKKRRSNARADERTHRERVRRTDIFTDNVIALLGLLRCSSFAQSRGLGCHSAGWRKLLAARVSVPPRLRACVATRGSEFSGYSASFREQDRFARTRNSTPSC